MPENSELHGFLHCRNTASFAAIEEICPISSRQDGCKLVGAWTDPKISVIDSRVFGPYDKDPMWMYLPRLDDNLYEGRITITSGHELHSYEDDTQLLKGIERSTLILGITIGFCTALAAITIMFLLYRRFRRRAVDRARPRALSPPRAIAPVPSSTGVRGKNTRQPQTPIPAAGDINSENERLWETLVALRNEIREMREGNTAETLPEYEPRDQRADS